MIDVIVPTFNRHEAIERLINDFKQQTDQDFTLNLIDQSEIVFKNKNTTKFKINIFWTPDIRSPILARNYGYEHTSSEIILFLDDDMIPSINLISNIKNIYKNYEKPLVIGGISNVRNQGKFERLIRKIFQRGIYNDPRYSYFDKAFKKEFDKIDSFFVTPYISASILSLNRIALQKSPLPTKFKKHILGGDIFYGMNCKKKGIRVCLSYLLSAEEIPDKNFKFKSIKGYRKIILSFHSAFLVLRINGLNLKNIFHFALRITLICLFLVRQTLIRFKL